MAAKIFRINYKSDFILTLNSDAGWMTPFCIKFWTGAPSQAFFVGWDGETYTHCSYDPSYPTKLVVQFDDHHLPIGELKYQVAYHFTVADFPNDTEDEVINPANITTEIDGQEYQVMLDFTGETAPEIQFSLPAYANEVQRIANEQQRIANEQQRIQNEETRIAQEETRQRNEATRIAHEEARVSEFARLKRESQQATTDANDAATLANQKAQLAQDKADLAQAAATLANQKAQLAADKAALANAASQLANEKAALAQQKAEYAQQQGGYAKDQGDYAKNQGDYAKAQGDTAQADHERAEADHGIAADDHTQAGNDHTRAESDHGIAVDDHTQAGNDHTRAESDHGIAVDDHTQAGNDHTRAESDHGIAADDHTQAGNDHTRAESDHTRAESDHAAVEVYVDSLGAFDISSYHATGGELAKYADLTAALGTDGANIPEGIRKGGMSVKFVQSSDNNYVQYFLTKNEWSASEDDWEKLNLQEELNEVETDVKGCNSTNQLTEDSTFDGYFINVGNAVLYTNNSASVAIYKISPNSRLNINIPKSGNSAMCSIGYSNNNTLEALTQTRSLSPDTNYMGTSSPQTIDTTSPSNKEYLLVCFTTTGGVPTVNVIEDFIPQVVRVDEIEYPNEAQEQARKNIGAASQEEVDDISEKCLGTYVEVEETLTIASTKSDKYISAIAETYGIPRVKEGWNTVFYSIRNGEDLNISIPKTCNSAAFSLAYADESMINGWSGVNPCYVIDGTKGTSGSKTYNVINSDNYPYLMVCYDVAGGLPTVTGTYEEISTLPVLVSTLPINYTDEQKAKARENIGAASQEEVRKHSIKVLMIGSSHGVNSFAQFPTMAYQAGVNIIAGNYYRGGGLTSQVAADCNDNTTLSGVQYSKFTNGEWSTKSVTKMEQILTDERWDIICLMRAASQCTTWTESMESDYDTIIAYITEKCDWSPKLTYMSGFADVNQYGHESDELIWTTAQNAKTKYGMEIVPMQPIIKICRDNPTLHDLGTYDYTDPSTGVTRHIGLLTCDGQHLDQGIGMYVGGCVSFNFYLRVLGMDVLTNNHLPTPTNGLIPGWYDSTKYTAITENYAKIIRQITSVYFANN